MSLPDKLYFRIGEVSDIVGVKPYVLRYWETEFTDIKPSKSKSGQRLYKKRDVELLLKIKELLYNERFTINGAKQRLREIERSEPHHDPHSHEHHHAVEARRAAEEEIDDVPETPDLFEGSSHSDADKKFLRKIRNDLDWCVQELKS